jgi:hypothetical protein
MISHKLLMAAAMVTAGALTACSDATAPKELAPAGASFARSGRFHAEKECSKYTGKAGDICTMTVSTLKEIEPGSTVTYASAAVGALVDSDVVLDLPGPGNNAAFGHCKVNLATIVGGCVFSGGTGKFQWFHAEVDLSLVGGAVFAWDGSYSFSPHN